MSDKPEMNIELLKFLWSYIR